MRIAVVALSPIERDGRVLRTAHALAQSGHEVHVLGYGPKPLGCSGEFHTLGEPPMRIQHWAWVLAGYVPSGLSPRLGQALTALRPLHRRCQRLLCAIRPDVIHANDWPALPIAMWGKQTTALVSSVTATNLRVRSTAKAGCGGCFAALMCVPSRLPACTTPIVS